MRPAAPFSGLVKKDIKNLVKVTGGKLNFRVETVIVKEKKVEKPASLAPMIDCV